MAGTGMSRSGESAAAPRRSGHPSRRILLCLAFFSVLVAVAHGGKSGSKSKDATPRTGKAKGSTADSAAKAKTRSKKENSTVSDERFSAQGKKSSAAAKGSCISQGGRFLPYPYHGKKPRKSPKGKEEGLTFCRVYKALTCCGRDTSDAAMLSVRMLQVGSEPSESCLELWEALQCAICHPGIGTQPGPPAICASFCDSLFAECKTAFFAADPTLRLLTPCTPRDALCSRGHEWASSGTEFCAAAGFQPINRSFAQAVELGGRYCFDGSLTNALPGTPRVEGGDGNAKSRESGWGAGDEDEGAWWDDWWGEDDGTFFGSRVMWAVGGLVLTAAAGLWRWHSMRRRKHRGAILAAKKLAEARAKQQAQYNRAKEKHSAKGKYI